MTTGDASYAVSRRAQAMRASEIRELLKLLGRPGLVTHGSQQDFDLIGKLGRDPASALITGSKAA